MYDSQKQVSKKDVSLSHNGTEQSLQFKDNRNTTFSISDQIHNSPKQVTQRVEMDNVSNAPIQRQENKTGLPDNLKSGIENLSGYSMNDVRVHYNSSQPAQLQAHAYAQGNQIHVASGQEKHLPHEAWHVVQQKQGRVQPTKQLKSKVNINDDAGLEREADIMGAKALQQSFTSTTTLQKKTLNTTGVAQREVNTTEPQESSFKQLEDLTLSQLMDYTDEQADWNIGLNSEEFMLIFSLLNFLEETSTIGLYGKFKVKDFYDYKGVLYDNIPELLHKLDIARKETNRATTDFKLPIENEGVFRNFVTFFSCIQSLEKFYSIIPKKVQKNMLGDVFAMMEMDKTLPTFYEYYQLPIRPVFENLKDSYYFAKYPKIYLSYAKSTPLAKQGFIRNFHRFNVNVLGRLSENIKNKKRNKPLTLVIYTSHDHSGSFVHKDSMNAVVSSHKSLTILIEGKPNLKAYSNMAAYIAKTYGKDGQIAQVLICGHGGTREIAMNEDDAGRISLDKNQEPTLEFFKNLISLMYSANPKHFLGHTFRKKKNDPSEIDKLSRIVFSACEVNAIKIPRKPADLQEQKKSKMGSENDYQTTDISLKDFFKKNKNLVQTIQDIVGDSEFAYPKILGANASIKAKGQTLIDSNTGKLDLISNQDEYITSSKKEYIIHGSMFAGVIHAAIQELTMNPKDTKKLILQRLQTQKQAKTLEDVFILSSYLMVQANDFDPLALLNDIVLSSKIVYDKFRELEENRKFPFEKNILNTVFGEAHKSTFLSYILPYFKQINFHNSASELVLSQIVLYLNNKPNWLMNILQDKKCHEIAPYLSWDILDNNMLSKLLKKPTIQNTRIAICGLAAENNAICRNFLAKNYVVESPKAHFMESKALLFKSELQNFNAISSAEALLRKITGKDQPINIKNKAVNANMTPMEQVKNLAYITPIRKYGEFTKKDIMVYYLPEQENVSAEAPKINKSEKFEPKTKDVFILGKTTGFYAVTLYPDFKHLVFVKQEDIKEVDFKPRAINIDMLRGYKKDNDDNASKLEIDETRITSV